MTPESQPEKSEWMQIAESDNASSSVRKVDKRLTWGTLVSVGAIAIAGSLFANANEEQSAVADITPATSGISSTASASEASPTTTKPVSTPEKSKMQDPAIAQPPMGEIDHDDEGEEHEGRGEHHDRDRGDDEDDDYDDDHEDYD